MVTIRPYPRARMPGTSAAAIVNSEVAITPKDVDHCSAVTPVIGPGAGPQIPLLPTFSVRRNLIRSCRDAHLRLLTLATAERTGRLAFRVDAAFHETIAICRGNPSFLAGVVQHDRMRQLLESRDAPDEGRTMVWLKEHLDIMEAVVTNDVRSASDLMRIRLINAMRHREADPLPPRNA